MESPHRRHLHQRQRHAWDIRLISVDALFRLVKIKEELEDQNTIDRIRAILVPQEFTRVDGIIDLVFNATKEVKSEEIEEEEEGEEERAGFLARVPKP